MMILWIFLGHHKIGLHLVVISMHFDVFFKVGIFFRVAKFQISLGVLEIPDIFGGER